MTKSDEFLKLARQALLPDRPSGNITVAKVRLINDTGDTILEVAVDPPLFVTKGVVLKIEIPFD